jgi:hypothetical protein
MAPNKRFHAGVSRGGRMRSNFAAGLTLLVAACGQHTEPAKGGTSPSPDPTRALEEYGKYIASSSKEGAISFVAVRKTMDPPAAAYQLTFKTGVAALMSAPNAENGNAAFVKNQGLSQAWEAKFCDDRLDSLMAAWKVRYLSGDLQNLQGETQSMALCHHG